MARRPPESLAVLAARLASTLDAWSLRERDAWGQIAQCRRRGQEPARWHCICTGTAFPLDQRGRTGGGRSVITERGYVLTREGLDAPAGAVAQGGAAARAGPGRQRAGDW